MKKVLQTSFIYAIFALLSGFYAREITKAHQFEGYTSLNIVHAHAFSLGVLLLLVLELIAAKFNQSIKNIKLGYIFYHVGLGLTCIMFLVRGTTQVLGVNLTSAQNSMISGFAGLGHIAFTIAIVLIFLKLIDWTGKREEK